MDKSLNMPDVALESTSKTQLALDWVGMSEIDLPIYYMDQNKNKRSALAKANCFVDLFKKEAKGIHMSRLFLALEELFVENIISFDLLKQAVDLFIGSHSGLSKNAYVSLDFDFLMKKPSLKSDNHGWKSYPVSVSVKKKEDKYYYELAFQIMYSSTCPCSAALARQLIQEEFKSTFSESGQVDASVVLSWLGSNKGIIATPHSQRSYCDIKILASSSSFEIDFHSLIMNIENTLKTPVQLAVKREDEQQFALLNGQNAMFCEDAARRVGSALNIDANIIDYYVKCNHLESLHPHNAISYMTKKGAESYFKIF